jgi:hypothetical protein
MNDHGMAAHFTAMTKTSEIIFNGTPENWPAFEHHLLTEAENPTIRWNQEITNYQPTDRTSKLFNFLKGSPENMTGALMDDLENEKIVDLVTPASQLYNLHCLKTKLKNCLTPYLAHDIEASMPLGLSNKYVRIFFITIISHTLKMEITESNNMEGFQQEL